MRRLASIPEGSTLGLNYTCMHDSSIAIVDPDGRPRFACALERLSRVKQDGRWPEALLSKVPWDRIQRIAIGSLSLEEARRLSEGYSRDDWPGHRKTVGGDRSPFPYPDIWHERIASLPQEPLRYDHHHSHAASAFFPSGFESALVLTMDAGAHQCPWHMAAYEAEGDEVQILAGMHFLEYAAPAHLYTLVTAILGLRPNRHEGKVTGLAARGSVDEAELAKFEELAWPLTERVGDLITWDLCEDVDYAPTVSVNESVRVDWRHRLEAWSDAQLAACAQQVLERRVLAILDHAIEISGGVYRNVCLAGGVFANVLLNQKVISRFDRGFVAPAMTDDGVAMGAALLAHHAEHPKEPRPGSHATMYLGPDLDSVEETLESQGLIHETTPDLALRVASALCEGCTVAVARGRMEFGPRALGHRSVLAQATDPSINDWLNRLLQRTEYMPFAPIVHRKRAKDLFAAVEGVEDTARFMTVTLDSLDQMCKASPAAVHVDRTARPQFVDEEDDPWIAEVLEHYFELTGLGAIINTSFNVHEQPITCTTEDALLGFAQTRLDYLVLQDFLVPRKGNEEALQAFLNQAESRPKAPGNLPEALAMGRWLDRLRSRTGALQEQCDRIFREGQATAAFIQEREDQRDQAQAELESRRTEMEELRTRSSAQISEMAAQLDALQKAHRSLLEKRWVRLGFAVRILD